MTRSVIGLRRSSKALPKAKFAPTKSHGHWLVIWWQSDQLELYKSWWNHYILEVCSANQWDALKTAKPAASIHHQKGSNSSLQQYRTTSSTTNASKLEWIGLWNFASSAIFTWLFNWLPLLQASWQTFWRKKYVHNQQNTENDFQEFVESRFKKARIFMLQEYTNLLLIGRNVLIVMVPILFNKGVFEPSYCDLKFRVWNHYYFCTNLIFDGKLQKPNKLEE